MALLHLIRKKTSKTASDVPLNNDPLARFSVTITALLAFLCMITLSIMILFYDVSTRWQYNLSSEITIELSALDDNGALIAYDKRQRLASLIVERISKNKAVKNAHMLDTTDMRQLIGDWLITDDSLPMPVLVAVSLTSRSDEILSDIESAVRTIAPIASIDTHQDWLKRLNTLLWAGYILGLVLIILLMGGLTLSIIGATRARLLTANKTVELLHIMGAGDRYITRQFIIHGLLLTLKGITLAVAGYIVLCGFALLFTMGLRETYGVSFNFGWDDIIIHGLFIATMLALTWVTTRITVTKILEILP